MATVVLSPRRRTARSRGIVRTVLLLLVLAVVLYPLAWMLGTSFKSPTEILSSASALPGEFTPGNYPQGWHQLDVVFGRFFLNSTLVALLVVAGNMFSCLLAAYAFARLSFPLRGLFFTLMIGTLLLPSH